MKNINPKIDLFQSFKYQNHKNNNHLPFKLHNQPHEEYLNRIQQKFSIINKINQTNNALNNKRYSENKQKLQNHPNYLTFCQKYSDILYQKYAPNYIIKQKANYLKKDFISSYQNKNIKQNSVKSYHEEQIILRAIFCFKRNHQQYQNIFSYEYEENKKIIQKNIEILKSKSCFYNQKSTIIRKQLGLMDLLTLKIARKMLNCKKQISPFRLFTHQNQSNTQENSVLHKNNNKKISLYQRQQRQQQNQHKNMNQNSYDQKSIHKTPVRITKALNNHNQNQKESKKVFLTNIHTPTSPNLLSGYKSNKQQDKIIQMDQNNLLISFKKNMESSARDQLQTLKYSESQINQNRYHFLTNNQKHKFIKFTQNSQEIQQNDPMYSPVQPYRQKILLQMQKKHKGVGINQINKEDLNIIKDHKGNGFNQQTQLQIYISSLLNQSYQNNLLQQTKNLQIRLKHQSSEKILKYAEKTLQYICQAGQSLNQIVQKAQLQIQTQKNLLNQQWNGIVNELGHHLQQIQYLIQQHKNQTNQKDNKFLINLQNLQSELIEQIFVQKQQRKQQQKVLTQMLSNLVQTLGGIE